MTGFLDYALIFFIVSGFISGLYELASSFSVVEVCFGMFNSLVFFGGSAACFGDIGTFVEELFLVNNNSFSLF